MNRLAALALLACAPFARAEPATETEWIAAATAAVAYGQVRGMPISLEVQSGAGLSGHTPVGIRSADGRCTLVVSARDNPTAERVSAMVAPELRALFLAGAAMHEVGHCHRRLQGYPHNEKLLPVVAWIGPVNSWFQRRIRREEAYADMTEVAWLARHHPDQYGAVLQEIIKVRKRFLEPKHDTLAWLALAMEDGPDDDGQDLFTMADRKLSRYR